MRNFITNTALYEEKNEKYFFIGVYFAKTVAINPFMYHVVKWLNIL